MSTPRRYVEILVRVDFNPEKSAQTDRVLGILPAFRSLVQYIHICPAYITATLFPSIYEFPHICHPFLVDKNPISPIPPGDVF